MAAGDIIIPDGRITPEILEKITSEVVNNIQTTSKDPGQYEEVESLTGITSIPVFQQSGSTFKLVRVLLSILKGVDGKEVHLQSTETHLQWRWTDGMWNNLIAWTDIKGDPGDTPVFRTGPSGIEWKYVSEDETGWKEFVTFEVLKLKFSDLTDEQITAFWQAIPEDVLALFQKPATEAADEVREQMSQISQNASAAIKAASDAAGNAQDAADNVQDGKTTQFEIGTVESGAAPSASLTDNGVDATGNPKKKLNLVMQKGDNAKSPTVQTGTITAGDPASEVTFTFAEVGMTEDGRPIWRVDGSIPRGQQGPPGTGSGNVLVDGTGLVIGKKYLFVPSSDDSTAGTFVEYVAPEIPEQVQPDWNATEGKGAILHKPGDATADASGLMSADQFQKLEKLNPSYLSNAVTGKKVEYTDAGKLLFEGKEAFSVDADNELTLAGKKLSDLGGGGTYEIPSALLMLDPSTVTSDEIKVAVGGDEGFNAIVQAILNNDILYLKPELELFVIVSSYQIETTNTNDTNIVFFISVNEGNMMVALNRTKENIYSLVWETNQVALLTSTSDTVYFKYSTNDGELMWNNNNADTDVGGRGPRYAAYSQNHNVKIEDDGDGTKALMNDGTYKVVGGDYTLPAATSAALGGIKVGYTAAEKNYPVQLDGSDKAYVNVPWTDTTYSPATQSANGLMSFGDKKKLDRIGSYTAATTVANLDANYENIEISNLSANASLSVNLTGTAYDTWSIYVAIYCSSARTITIPTSGNYISMIGSSLTCPAGKWTELHLKCLGGKWRIAKLEQE